MAIFSNRPLPQADNFNGGPPSRAGRYSDAYVMSVFGKDMVAADEGSYFVAPNATAGTGIIGHAAPTTFDETKPYLFVYNGGQNRIYPQALRLHDTVVSVGGTRIQFNQTLDYGNKYTSGGTALVPVNTNADAVGASAALVYAGAVVVAAATANRRKLGNYIVRGGVIDVVHDTYELVWGGTAQSAQNSLTGESTTAAKFVVNLPPVVIGPGQCLAIHQWAASQSTGPTFEVEFSYVER